MNNFKISDFILYYILLILFLLLGQPVLNAQGWEKTIDLQAIESFKEGSKVAPMHDGGFAIVGRGLLTQGFTVLDMIVARVDRNGNLLWHNLFIEQIIEVTTDIKATVDGGVIVAGTGLVISSSSLDIHLVKLDSWGNIEWEMTYDNNNNYESAYSICLTQDGGYIVAGKKMGPDSKMYVLKVSSNGTKEWDRIIGINQYEQAHEVIAHPDGTYTLAGWAEINGKNETKLVKLDATGNTLWEQTYAGATNQASHAAVLLPDGSYILTGETDSNDAGDIWLLKIDSAGTEEWTKTLPLPNQQNSSDIILTPEGGFAIAASTTTVGSFSGHAIKTDSLGNIIWQRDFGTTLNGVSLTDEGGFLFTGSRGWSVPFDSDAYAVKLSNDGQVSTSFLTGKVVFDQNNSCTKDTLEPGMSNWMLEAKGNGSFYGYTDAQGNYFMNVDSGTYELIVTSPVAIWQPCQQPHLVYVDTNMTAVSDILMQALDSCTHMTVDISAPFLRRCFGSRYNISYCNLGSITAVNPYIEIEFDPYLMVDSSAIPWTSQIGNTYTFPIADLNINECGSFWVDVTVDCDSTVLGQTHCSQATIFPSNDCIPPTSNWDGSITSLDAQCEQDSVLFTISNTGAGNMANPLNIIVAEDNIIMKTDQFQLDAGMKDTVKVPTNGSTYRLFAEQSPGYFPPKYLPTIAIEGCGIDSTTGVFSTGFVTMYAENDFLDDTSIDCQENIDSYDPNDKRAEPKGFGTEHFINIGDDLEYHIRFQNTGTDTAYTVIIRDTLSQHLDVNSLKQGAFSHPYALTIINDNILKFVFSNIQLVDSTTNEPASHGYVKFRISQKENLPLGTMIYNQAAIYFDFNEPIITSQTFHEIGEDFIPIKIFSNTTEIPDHPNFNIKVQPNPFYETTEIILEEAPKGIKTFKLFDVMGRLLRQEQFDNETLRFSRNELQEGIYIYTIQIKGQPIGNGKIIIQGR